jgi:hypothetical protein
MAGTGGLNLQEMTLQEKQMQSYLLGCIKYNNEYSYYTMPFAWWVLNYSEYDPSYNPDDWKDIFRNNILDVTDDQIGNYIDAIEEDKITDLTELKTIETEPAYAYLYFFIDFDSKLFISHFDDIDIEEYLPDEKWQGIFKDPITYIPEECREYFSNSRY